MRIVCLIVALLLCIPIPAYAATDDPLFPQQWGLRRVGAETAWETSKGAGVIIAIIDTGVHLDHPDLKSQLVPGTSVVDDNGAEDTHGHGTLIAGIAAAAAGNAEGIAGVAPEAKILPVRVFDRKGSATSARVAQAIRFAVDAAASRRAKLVLNLSFVGSSQLDTGTGTPGPILGDEAVKKAITDAAASGAAVVTAAGNEGSATTAFDAPPGKGIIVVGASDQEDNCAPFTNYGPGLDVLAPGVGILTTFWSPVEKRLGYLNADGTSMAVPFVSGALALMMSKGMSNVQAVNRIIATASGAGVSCKGEKTKYRVLDIPLAMGLVRGPAEELEEGPVITEPGGIIPAGSATPEEVAAEQPEDPAEETPIYELTWARGLALLFFLIAVNFVVAFLKKEQYY